MYEGERRGLRYNAGESRGGYVTVAIAVERVGLGLEDFPCNFAQTTPPPPTHPKVKALLQRMNYSQQ